MREKIKLGHYQHAWDSHSWLSLPSTSTISVLQHQDSPEWLSQKLLKIGSLVRTELTVDPVFASFRR